VIIELATPERCSGARRAHPPPRSRLVRHRGLHPRLHRRGRPPCPPGSRATGRPSDSSRSAATTLTPPRSTASLSIVTITAAASARPGPHGRSRASRPTASDFLQVKTMGPSKPNRQYAMTLRFLQVRGLCRGRGVHRSCGWNGLPRCSSSRRSSAAFEPRQEAAPRVRGDPQRCATNRPAHTNTKHTGTTPRCTARARRDQPAGP
jgi:hypothetical protein